MNQSLLTIICPPSLERPVTDWLLEQEAISGFTSLQVHGHGSDPLALSLIEQVEGRKKQIMFQVHLSSEIAENVINALKQNFKGADIHYWLVPVTATGNLSRSN